MFLKNGFKKCTYEHTLFINESKGNLLIVCIYVDDLVFTGNSHEMIETFKNLMKVKFEMTDIGLLHYFLGIEVKQERNKISISQQKYAKDLLKRFNIIDSSPKATPMEFGLKLSKNNSGKIIDSSPCS